MWNWLPVHSFRISHWKKKSTFRVYRRKVGGRRGKNWRFQVLEENIDVCEESKTNHSVGRTILMDVVEGFCLKCKTYGPIKDGQLIKMKNGRTRMGGVCSQPGCTGKISKIVSWIHLPTPMWFNTPFQWTGYLGARGLGVMTLPWHGKDREFNSLRAHHSNTTVVWFLPFSILNVN